MGIEIGLAVAALAVGIVSTVVQLDSAAKSRAAQKETQEISQADQAVQRESNIRRAVRSSRVQRAKIQQASSNVGSGTSSGSTGAISNLRSSLDNAIGTVGGQVKTAQSLSDEAQKDADARYTAQVWGSISNLFNTAASSASSFKTKLPNST